MAHYSDIQLKGKDRIEASAGCSSLLKMQCLLLLLSLPFIVTSLSLHQHPFILSNSTLFPLSLTLDVPSRLTFLLYNGQPLGSISSHNQTFPINSSFQQLTFKYPANLTLLLQGPAIGTFLREPLEEWSTISLEEEMFLQLATADDRAVELDPRRGMTLSIFRLEGTPTLAYSRCKLKEKRDCLARLMRANHSSINGPVETLRLQPCSDCVVMLLFRGNAKVRLSLESALTVLAGEPGVGMLKEGQKMVWLVCGLPEQIGRVVLFSGKTEVAANSTSLELVPLDNGWEYYFKPSHKPEAVVELTITAVTLSSFAVEGSSPRGLLRLKDGVPASVLLEEGAHLELLMPKGLVNLHLTGQTQLLASLAIRFFRQHQSYSSRPKFYFSHNSGSQNFQLDNSSGQFRATVQGGHRGQVNISVSAMEPLLLGVGGRHSSVVRRDKADRYILPPLEEGWLLLKKCVPCQLSVKIGPSGQDWEEVAGRELLVPMEHHHILQVTTNNYAFYSVQILSRTQQPSLPNSILEVFLTEPDGQVELQFHPPLCGQHPCQEVQYYLIEGSDPREVASRGYCPNTLFDFDERTKDIQIQQTQPLFKGSKAVVQLSGSRDWALVVMTVGRVVLSTDLADVGEVLRYASLRWPLFYLLTFLTLAGVVAVAAVMGGRRGRDSGYVRAGSRSSAQLLE